MSRLLCRSTVYTSNRIEWRFLSTKILPHVIIAAPYLGPVLRQCRLTTQTRLVAKSLSCRWSETNLGSQSTLLKNRSCIMQGNFREWEERFKGKSFAANCVSLRIVWIDNNLSEFQMDFSSADYFVMIITISCNGIMQE